MKIQKKEELNIVYTDSIFLYVSTNCFLNMIRYLQTHTHLQNSPFEKFSNQPEKIN